MVHTTQQHTEGRHLKIKMPCVYVWTISKVRPTTIKYLILISYFIGKRNLMSVTIEADISPLPSPEICGGRSNRKKWDICTWCFGISPIRMYMCLRILHFPTRLDRVSADTFSRDFLVICLLRSYPSCFANFCSLRRLTAQRAWSLRRNSRLKTTIP